MSSTGPEQANVLRTKMKAYAKDVVDFWFLRRLKRDKQLLDKRKDVSEVVPLLCRSRGRGTILANQDPQELSALSDKLLTKPPKVVVEVGTAKGGTLYLWTRLAAPDALVVSIDKPGEIGSVGWTTLSLYRRFGQERGVQVFTIAADSHSESAHQQLRRILGNRKVDFLFIDGDHRYEGVRADFYGYRSYLAPQSIVAMHDVGVPDTHPEIQVGRFWSEILDHKLTTRTLISQPGRTPGIGVVFID